MPESTSHQLVVFALGSEEYALPIGAAREIIRMAALTQGRSSRSTRPRA